ncbi:hypothetical protein CC78DRAFT_483810, partial [Lojkania enalia]
PDVTDENMLYRLPPIDNRTQRIILPEDRICKETQRTRNQTMGSPMLSARTNDTILLLYLENGHVTRLDDDRAHNASGKIHIYGTLSPSPNDTLQDVQRHSELHGHRGRLSTANFDDGHCYEDNGTPIALQRKALPQRPHLEDGEGSNLWCTCRFRLPALVSGSIYTIYWVWDFSGLDFIEIYTTCLDVHIIA